MMLNAPSLNTVEVAFDSTQINTFLKNIKTKNYQSE
jgi:hypothetical protein